VNSPCLSNEECKVGSCVFPPRLAIIPSLIPNDVGQCSAGARGEACLVDADCAKNSVCFGDSLNPDICYDGQERDPCRVASNCQSGFCAPPGRPTDGKFCTLGQEIDPCATGADCQSGHCVALFMPSDKYPNPNLCEPGTLHSACVNDDDCNTGLRCDETGNVCVALPAP
jgi:hypothetical protein